MRDIKFRAWNGGEMQYNFNPSPFTFSTFGNPIMQFTGLKDKNGIGKEVYESDLFEVVYSNVPNGFEAMNFKKELKINIGEVVFRFGGFKIKTFYPDHQEYVYMDLHTFLKNDEKVVIGSIHQNKELLES
jgi:uncharacterized phage protein (TIGR01671 family)